MNSLKPYMIYVTNTKNGSARDMILNAKDSSHARMLCESLCLRKNEQVLSVYPLKKR